MILTTILSLAILGQIIFPGNALGLEEAQEKANIIVVGKITSFAPAVGQSHAYFGSFAFKRLEALKGKPEETASGQLTLVAVDEEMIQKPGEEYVIFIFHNDYNKHVAIKLLPKTKEYIDAAKKEIENRKSVGPRTRPPIPLTARQRWLEQARKRSLQQFRRGAYYPRGFVAPNAPEPK